MVIAVLCIPGKCLGDADPGVLSLADRLDSIDNYAATISYAVSLPMADDDVVYTLNVATSRNPSDHLLGENYLIDWTLPAESGESRGFTAYFDGHHYRYRDHRLQENHYMWDSIPFRTNAGGIQRNGQFVNLLPFSLSSQLRAMAADSTWTVSLAEGLAERRKADIVSARRHVNGIESQQFELAIDPVAATPLSLSVLYNPGMLGEQEVNARYEYPTSPLARACASEQQLMGLYPEVFEKYRVSNYSVENLRGLPLPGFALPTITRQRHLYQKGDRFASPVIIAVLDPSVASTAPVIGLLRDTIDKLPRQTSLILMFNSNDIDRIEPLTGPPRMGETLLTSAIPFIRDCGINAFPTILLCDSSGIVSSVILGSASTLGDDLLQRGALLK